MCVLTYIISCVPADGDDTEWGVELSVLHGFLTLNETALPGLHFELGDGASDRYMYFTGRYTNKYTLCMYIALTRSSRLLILYISKLIGDGATGTLLRTGRRRVRPLHAFHWKVYKYISSNIYIRIANICVLRLRVVYIPNFKRDGATGTPL